MGGDGQRRKRLLVSALAGIVAAGAFVLMLTQISTHTQPQAAGGTTGVATTKVVVAQADIHAGDVLSADNVAAVDYPSSALPVASVYFTSTTQLLASTQYSTVSVPRGTLILTTQLTQEVAPVKLPPINVADGDVAMSIPYDEGSDSAGYIQQGDYVDFMVDNTQPGPAGGVHYAFQGIHVLRVGDRSSQPAASPAAAASAATLLLIELPREQALALGWALDQHFSLRIVIRPHDQQSPTSLPSSSPVTQGNWLGFLSG